MIRNFTYSQLSIANKIRLLLTIGGLSITIAVGLIYTYFMTSTVSSDFNQSTINTAALIGERNIAAIRFNDTAFADKSIAAAKNDKSLKSICLYNSEGSLFAYSNGKPADCPTIERTFDGLSKETFVEEKNDILLVKNIFDAGEKVGAIYIKRERLAVNNFLFEQLKALGAICIGCIVLAFIISKLIERMIAKPIVSITQHASLIARQSSMASSNSSQFYKGQDELGRLIEAFNLAFGDMQGRLIQENQKNVELVRAQNENFEKMKTLSEEYMECIESFLVYSELVMSNTFGPRIQNYSPYRFDVLESMSNYHVRLESHTRIARLCGNAISQGRTNLELNQYLREFASKLKKLMPFASIQQPTFPLVTLIVYKEPWDEIFNILCNFLETLSAALEFNNTLKIAYDEVESLLYVTCAEKLSLDKMLSSSNDNKPLSYFEFSEQIDDMPTPYVKNTIDDPEAADNFIKEDSYQRADIKYILATINYIASTNSITSNHSFVDNKFTLTLSLEKCKNITQVIPREMVI